MDINLLDRMAYSSGHPFDQYRWLRENAPVYWHADPSDTGFWVVTSYDLVRRVELDFRTFSSEPASTIYDERSLNDKNDTVHKHLIMSDPPHHTVHRTFLSPELSPLPVKSMSASIEHIADEIIDDVIEQGECDLVPDIAEKLASYVTADLLGLPRAEVVELYAASDQLNRSRSIKEGDGLRAAMTLAEHARHVFLNRRDHPRDDIVSRIAYGEIAGCPMDVKQSAMDFHLLVVAGGDTTRNVVAGGVVTLFDNPQQRGLLASNERLLASAVEEMLRWVTPIVYQRRLALEDTVVGGKKITKGARSWCSTARPIATPTSSRNPIDSTSCARQTGISLSVSASTSAWARTWLASSCASCSGPCFAACPASSWQARSSGWSARLPSPRRSSAPSRSRSGSLRVADTTEHPSGRTRAFPDRRRQRCLSSISWFDLARSWTAPGPNRGRPMSR